MPFIQTNDNYKPELLEEYNTFRLMHGYDMKLKVWKFIGYTCTKCNRTVKNPNIVPKHFQNCKAGPPTIYKQEPDPDQIVNVRGEPWQPYEINQKKPLINTE